MLLVSHARPLGGVGGFILIIIVEALRPVPPIRETLDAIPKSILILKNAYKSACILQFTAYNLELATYSLQLTTCNLQFTICNLQLMQLF